jgi:hypothetical protein
MTAKLDGGCPFGFRIVGGCFESRRLVDAAVAFSAYASCDDRAEINREGYLSAFWYGVEFRRHLAATNSTKGFNGVCWSPWLWFDIDREDIGQALHDARRLVAFLVDRYRLDDDALLTFFSGSKGFHVGVPTALWLPSPSVTFHATTRRLAEALAVRAGIVIDVGVYDRVRAFRAPNSRHPKTGLHKRRLTFDELLGLSADAILRLAEKPEAFDVPRLPPVNEQAATDWREAVENLERATEAKADRRAAGMSPRLNRKTRDLIANAEPIAVGDRHRLLFSAAANLAEFGCSMELAWALLSEAGLDSGLSPSEVRRQIECGLKHHTGGAA